MFNNNRPIEVKNILNPPFCVVLIWETIQQYQDEGYDGLPYSLSFLILPIVLHKRTRDAMPRSRSTKLHVWLQKNPHLKIGFVERTKQITVFTNEAIYYGLKIGLLSISTEGQLFSKTEKIKPMTESGFMQELSECRKKAQFLGKWFADSGSTSTIFSEWGLKP